MASSSETGHAINVSNFKLLIDKCDGFGASYQPSNGDLTIASLTAQWGVANTAQATINFVLQQVKEPINERGILFEPLSGLVTRVVNVLNSTRASEQVKLDAKGIADVIRGFRKKKTPTDGVPGEEWVSTSHMSYVMRAENFLSLINLLKTVPIYAPNEVELKIASLETLYTSMKSKNDAIGVIIAPVDNARIARNEALYTKDTGIVDVAKLVKKYVKGAYGATSERFKLVSGIKFTRPKKQ